jgi:hypothetical protein
LKRAFNKGIRHLTEQTNKQNAICSYGISPIEKVNEISALLQNRKKICLVISVFIEAQRTNWFWAGTRNMWRGH